MVAKRELLESLREQVQRIETAGRPNGQFVSLGCPALDALLPQRGDALLPQRGIARGTIHEWLAPRGGSGAEILSLIAAREACRDGGALAVIDSIGCFYPPAAALWGIGLENTIVIRSDSRRDAAWAIDQALRCSAVAAVWGFVDLIGERWLRRFQLSAEQSGCLGLFVRPAAEAGKPTWSESQWLCRGVPRRASRNFRIAALAKPVAHQSKDSSRELAAHQRDGEDRLVQVRLARLRGGAAGASVTLQIDFQTGGVQVARRDNEADCMRLSERLANPTVGRKTARA